MSHNRLDTLLEADSTTLTVVVVDDSMPVRKLLEKALSSKGYQVISFASGQELLEFTELPSVDLILLDQVMPELTGLETYKRLILGPKAPPCIMLTGDESQSLAVEFMRLGGVDFIPKPFDMAVLDLSVRRAIDESQLRDRFAEEKLARRAAEESNHLKDEFLANISHELRTPLHGIISFTDKALRNFGDEVPPKLHRYLTVIQSSGFRLQNLMDNLMELVKLESKHEAFRPKTVRLDHLIKMAVGAKSQELSAKSQQVILPPDLDGLTACADTGMIIHLLDQVLANAIKYSDMNTRINIEFQPTQLMGLDGSLPAIRLSFLDQGIGVPEAELESIFEKFTQSSRTNTGSGGTGLGLSIARGIVNCHGGRIWAENRPTGGSCFSFTLPSVALTQ